MGSIWLQNGALHTDPPSPPVPLRKGALRSVISPSSRSTVAPSVVTNVFCRTGLHSSIHHRATNRGDGILHGCPCPWGPSLFRDSPSAPNYASRAPAKSREPYTRLSGPASCVVTAQVLAQLHHAPATKHRTAANSIILCICPPRPELRHTLWQPPRLSEPRLARPGRCGRPPDACCPTTLLAFCRVVAVVGDA